MLNGYTYLPVLAFDGGTEAIATHECAAKENLACAHG
jgi:hypothetical protein